ncbi:MAG: heme NO-binding domain-containing protein [Nocardioides sp.]
MKGIIFNLVEDAVTAEHGETVWDSLVESAGIEGVFTTLGNYPCHHLSALVEAGAVTLGVTPAELTRELGRRALLGLAERYPRYFEGFTSTSPFLLTLSDVIHAEVQKLYGDTRPPEFWFEECADQKLRIHYRSGRQLCTLAEGMIAGAASYYGEWSRLSHVQCMLDGADHCVIDARFTAR